MRFLLVTTVSIFLLMLAAWHFAGNISALFRPVVLPPLTGPVHLSCPYLHHRKDERLISMGLKTVQAAFFNKQPGISEEEHTACNLLNTIDFIFSFTFNEKEANEHEMDKLYKGAAASFLAGSNYRDDLMAMILHRLVDRDIWQYGDWINTRLWLGMLYANSSGSIYDPAMAEYQFRRVLMEKALLSKGRQLPDQCLDFYEEEQKSAKLSDLHSQALEWFHSVCLMNKDALFQEAEAYEKGLNGYPQDLYMALMLYHLSGSDKAKEQYHQLLKLKYSRE